MKETRFIVVIVTFNGTALGSEIEAQNRTSKRRFEISSSVSLKKEEQTRALSQESNRGFNDDYAINYND